MCIAEPGTGEEYRMAQRGSHNPVRAVRWGAVVLLALAGTVATLVVSEWPLTGQSIARSAAERAPKGPQPLASKRVPVQIDWPLRGTFMPEEPDPNQVWRPSLMAAGSAEESRRELEARSTYTPASKSPKAIGPSGLAGVGAWREDTVPRIDLADYLDWWQSTPNGKLVEELSAYDPAHTAASLRISPRVDVTAGLTRFNSGDGPSVGKIEFADGTRPRGEADLYDFSVRLDALGAGPDARRLNLGAISGVRAASLYDPQVRDTTVRDPIPVIGGDARWKWSNQSMLRASALSDAPGTDRDYLDLRLEQVWRFGGDAWLSLGWRRMQGILSNEQPAPTLKQDAILLELKIGF